MTSSMRPMLQQAARHALHRPARSPLLPPAALGLPLLLPRAVPPQTRHASGVTARRIMASSPPGTASPGIETSRILSIFPLRRSFRSTSLAGGPQQQPTPSQPSTASKAVSAVEEASEAVEEELPPKATIRERLRFMSRRYGWWALGVYLLLSAVDFALTFAAVHFLGAEHIRELEAKVRNWIGLHKRDHADEKDTGKNLKQLLGIEGGRDEPSAQNNKEARREIYEKINSGEVAEATPAVAKGSKNPFGSSTLWAEAVLAYTIHKTLLLPVRVAATAAVLPSFVKLMVRWGLSKPNAAVRQAAQKIGQKVAKSA